MYISENTVSKSQEIIVPYYSVQYFIQFWSSHLKKDSDHLEQVGRRATQIIKGLKIPLIP